MDVVTEDSKRARQKKLVKKPVMLVPARRDESSQPGPSTKIKASTTVTTVIKPCIPFTSSDSESDEETVYNYLKMTPSGLLMRPMSPDFVQYIRSHVIAKTAEFLSEFSFDDYATPYDFIKVKLPKLKDTMSQYDLDMLVKVFYLSLERNEFLIGVQHLFLDSKSGGRSEYWNVEGTHNFEVLVTIIFFLAAQLDPENLVEILTENPWKGLKRFYKFLLKQRKKRKGGHILKLAKKEFSSEFIKTHISPNLKATRHIIRKFVNPPKEKSTIQLPPALREESEQTPSDNASPGTSRKQSNTRTPVKQPVTSEKQSGTSGKQDGTSRKQSGTETPAKQPGTETPTKQPGTEPPAKQPGTEPPAKQLGTKTPAKQPGTETPAKQPGTEPPAEQPGTACQSSNFGTQPGTSAKAETSGKQTVNFGTQPRTSAIQPVTFGTQPGTSAIQPATFGTQLVTFGTQLVTFGTPPRTSGKQSETSGKQAGTSRRQSKPHAPAKQLGTSAKQAETSGKQAETSGKQAETSGKQAGTSRKQFGTETPVKQPGNSAKQFKTTGRQAGTETPSKQSETSGIQPVATFETQTRTSGIQSVSFGTQLGSFGIQPGTSAIQSGTRGIQPGSSGTKNPNGMKPSRPFTAAAPSTHTLQQSMFLPFPFVPIRPVKMNTLTVGQGLADIMQVKKLATNSARHGKK